MTESYEQWGRVYPDGTITWQTASGWTPPWSTKDGRDAERASYSETLNRLGIEATGEELSFVRREQVITYTEIELIDDTGPEPEPEPEPEPAPDGQPVE